jgi:translation initiation factor 1
MDFNNTFNIQDDFLNDALQKRKIHIRFQKTGPRSITLIEGLDEDLDQHRIAKAMKKAFSCSASIQKDEDGNEVIQLQGDQRDAVKSWLVEQEILTEKEAKERLVMHGT